MLATDFNRADMKDNEAIKTLLEELENANTKSSEDQDNGEGECDNCDEYSRTATIEFPCEAAAEYGFEFFEVPKRILLELLAERYPEFAVELRGIRADYYAGDCETDHFHSVGGGTLLSAEQRAINRVKRAADRLERERKREAFEKELAGDENEVTERDAPFAAELDQIRQEEEHLRQRSHALDVAWDKFVVDREGWGQEREKREATVRAELDQLAFLLNSDSDALADRKSALQA